MSNGVIPMSRTDWTGPEGYGGVLTTLGLMARAATATSRHPRWKMLASQILVNAGVPQNDQLGESRALFNWMRQKIRYTRDPHNFEWVQSPLYSVLAGNGDCDCQTALLASLLMSVGFPVRLVIMGRPSPLGGEANYFHVFLATAIRDQGGKRWIWLDPTIEAGFDVAPRQDGPVYKLFDITPDGGIVEAKEKKEMSPMNGNYGLGDLAADFIRKPDGLVIETTKGRTIKVPWSLSDLRIVSDADTDKWLRDLRAQGVTAAEIVQIPEVLARAMSNPIMAARAGLAPDELATFQGLSGYLGSAIEGEYLGALDMLGGFFKSMGKSLKKVALPLGAVLAAPLTGGASLAAVGAMAALKKKKAAGGKLSPKEEAALNSEPPSASLTVVPGADTETPEIKATATKKYLLAGGAVAAAGGGAYYLSQRNR